MTKICELIEDFKLNQEIVARKEEYIDVCMYRLYKWEGFTSREMRISDVEEIKALHIKKYIQACQSEGKQSNGELIPE